MVAHVGYPIDRKRVTRLLRLNGLGGDLSKPHISVPGTPAQCYPYLLRKMRIERCNQVWGCDITYIRVRRFGTDEIAPQEQKVESKMAFLSNPEGIS